MALCSEYLRSLIPENVLPVNALRAGASLPVAIVAGCLELLRRIPGFTMIGTKPLLKLGISIAIDFIGTCVSVCVCACVRVRACACACICACTCALTAEPHVFSINPIHTLETH